MELEQSSIDFKPQVDRRPHMPQPPPVRVVAIEDVRISASAGLEVQLDDFYGNLLKFEREPSERGHLKYKAENLSLCIEIIEPPLRRQDMRPVGIDVPSLALLERSLIDREIEYQWQRGLIVGSHTLLFQDPAGNWVQVGEIRPV